MRKSMFATAVVATAGLAASANAGFWSISGANYINGTTTNLSVSSLANSSYTGISGFGGSANTETLLSAGDVTTILTGVGVTLASNTLTYFGFDGAVGPALGYFGVAFKNTSGSNYYFNMQGGSQAAGGSQGVLITDLSGQVGGGQWANTFGSPFTVASGSTFLVVFGGLAVGTSFQYQAESMATASGGAGGASFAIDYLSFNGSAYASAASASTATASGLNTALYQIPVPAPVLLAGAGLVGAAALRRRMTKKA